MMAAPRVIFDSHHPKHYLLLRQLGRRCEARGISVVWTARDKDVLVDLMREDGIDPVVLTTARGRLVRKLGELAEYDWKLLRLARSTRPAALMGKTISLTHVGRLLGIPSILVNDDSARSNPQFRYLGNPFATRIVSPDCLNEHYGTKHRTFPGLLHLAYLHPDVFTPDPSIRGELGVPAGSRLFLVRLAAFDAYHDVVLKGFSRDLVDATIKQLSGRGQVFISSEAPLPDDLERYRLPILASRLHHFLAACDLVVGDGLSVCVEAALLGTPAIALGSYVASHSPNETWRVLQRDYGLIQGFTPEEGARYLTCLRDMIGCETLARDWAARREAMLRDLIDPTEVLWQELGRFVQAAREAESDRPEGLIRAAR